MFTRALFAAAAMTALCGGGALAQRPSYDRHFLDSTEYFIAHDSLNGAYQYLAVARLVQAPSAATRGEGQFLVVGSGAGFEAGQRVWTRWSWRTRQAETVEAALGTGVFCLNVTENDVYRAPRSRDEALNGGWFWTTITDVSDLFRQEVRAGDYRLSVACLRVDVAAGPGAAVAAGPPQLDGHFLDSAEYFIAPNELSGAYQYLALGRMVIGPTETSRGEAQFLVVGSGANYTVGQRVWTHYYWRSRRATPQEATVGRQVFCANLSESDVYRGPRDRAEALNGGWFWTTITDTSNLYRQEVQAGDYRLGLGCLRVER